MARKAASKAEVAQWLRDQTPEHLEFLAKMRTKLVDHLDALPPRMVPDRDWARVAQVYQAGFHAVVHDARESAKLAILAAKSGAGPQLSDEELDAELRRIGIEAVRELPTADLAIELANRGLTMPDMDRDSDPD